MVKCQLLKMSAHGKMSATQNVGFLLKMSALKKYSKFKSKCAYINHSKSNNTSAYINVSAYKSACAYNLRSASKLLLFGLGGLSTLLSFSARLGWWYWHAMTKTCQNVGTLQNVGVRRHFDHFSKGKSKS